MTVVTKKEHVGIDLTEGSVLKGLFAFAVPIILANLIQQLYSMVDLLVIGQYVGSTGTVGVSTGGEISDLLTPIATSFAAAGQVYIAQLFGAKEKQHVRTAVGSLLSMMLLLSVGFVAVTVLFRAQILRLMNCPVEAYDQAMSYMLITTLGMPFIFGYNAVCSILRGMGESKKPLVFIIIAATVNVVLDLLLVVVFHMDVTGTAIATVAAQILSCLAAFFYMYWYREQFDFEMKLSYFKLDAVDCKVILSIGIPQAIRSSLVRFSILWVNANLNAYGLVISATNSVSNKIQKFLDVFSSGISQAAGAMVGQNLGARKTERAKKTVYSALVLSFSFIGVICLLILAKPASLVSIFTSDPEVLQMGAVYMRILIWHFLLSAITGSFQSMVIGSGYASLNFVIGIMDGVACKIGFSILFADVMGWGYIGYFWAIALSRLIPGLVCMSYFASGKWKRRKLLGSR